MTYVKKYKCTASSTTPAMRRFLATHHDTSKSYTKLPNPRDAALQALTIDAQYADTEPTAASPPPKSIKLSLHVGSLPPSSPKPVSRPKRVCSTPGCRVQHTPIWWNADDKKPYSDNKVCHRCHLIKSIMKK
jgi:hypothetical protein